MKETEEKSSLNDYHRERNKKAVLAVEEMKNRPYSLEEMKEQTTRILSTVSPEERGIVLEISGESGSIRIFKKRIKTKSVFIYQHNETNLGETDLSANKTRKYESFELAFQEIINSFQLDVLYISTIDFGYSNFVANELVKRLNLSKMSADNFKNKLRFEEVLKIKFEFNAAENKWKKRIEGIDQLIEEARKFQIEDETQSYLHSYPYFINYFANIQNHKIEIDNLVIGIHFVYGWMPTIFEFKNQEDFVVATEILNKAKVGEPLKSRDYETLKRLLNGSLVGTSKLLHFINPEKYAIWDSRVHNYLRKNIESHKFSYDIGDISNYERYLNYLSEVTNSVEFSEIYSLVNEKIETKFKYKISSFRAIELLMFINGKK